MVDGYLFPTKTQITIEIQVGLSSPDLASRHPWFVATTWAPDCVLSDIRDFYLEIGRRVGEPLDDVFEEIRERRSEAGSGFEIRNCILAYAMETNWGELDSDVSDGGCAGCVWGGTRLKEHKLPDFIAFLRRNADQS